MALELGAHAPRSIVLFGSTKNWKKLFQSNAPKTIESDAALTPSAPKTAESDAALAMPCDALWHVAVGSPA